MRSLTSFEAGKATMKHDGQSARFDLETPDWVFWMPLVIFYRESGAGYGDEWCRTHIPEFAGVRLEREDDAAGDEEARHRPWLTDEEIELLAIFRAFPAGDQASLLTELRKIVPPIAI